MCLLRRPSKIRAPAGVVTADHTHFLETGNGGCVLLAQNGGEGNVQLPFASRGQNPRHPLHVLVHTGERPVRPRSVAAAAQTFRFAGTATGVLDGMCSADAFASSAVEVIDAACA